MNPAACTPGEGIVQDGEQNISFRLFPTFKHKCSGAWNHVNGSCIWVRGGGGLADPLSDQIWALHLHIARTTPDYLCALLAHIALCT